MERKSAAGPHSPRQCDGRKEIPFYTMAVVVDTGLPVRWQKIHPVSAGWHDIGCRVRLIHQCGKAVQRLLMNGFLARYLLTDPILQVFHKFFLIVAFTVSI